MAGLLIAWTFTSPNRFLRDNATKALRMLLSRSPAVMGQLLDDFAAVDDPYVTERLAVVTHSVLLSGGDDDLQERLALTRKLRETCLDAEQVPNLITRDAVVGSHEWALRAGLIERAEYESVLPPYGSQPPGKPRTERQLENAFGLRKKNRQGEYISSLYGSIFYSLFGMGDFGRYVADSKVRRFTQHPLSEPIPEPPPPPPATEPADPSELLEALGFRRALTESAEDLSEALLDSLGEEDQRESIAAAPKRKRKASPDKSWQTVYPGDLARRWIFERVIEMGWTPERFADLERYHIHGSSRSSHKPERFGKKYQWIALRELLARLADNFHMVPDYGDQPRPYQGPWQFYGRDIDPTLPPAQRERDDEDDSVRTGPTFPPDPRDVWWDPGGPRFRRTDPPARAGWATKPEGIPEWKSLLFATDDQQDKWVVLQAYYSWDDEREKDERWQAPRRNLWSYIFSWLVSPKEIVELVAALGERSFMGRWMPEGREITSTAYLGEMPWASAARAYPPEWELVQPRYDHDEIGIEVYPAWEEYIWEGGTRDCSISESVSASLPAPLLLEEGGLSWEPETRQWRDSTGLVQARHVANEAGQRALLERETWLAATLKRGKWALVVGWLGEKQLFESDITGGLMGNWTEMNGIAYFTRNRWKLEPPRLVVTDRRGD